MKPNDPVSLGKPGSHSKLLQFDHHCLGHPPGLYFVCGESGCFERSNAGENDTFREVPEESIAQHHRRTKASTPSSSSLTITASAIAFLQGCISLEVEPIASKACRNTHWSVWWFVYLSNTGEKAACKEVPDEIICHDYWIEVVPPSSPSLTIIASAVSSFSNRRSYLTTPN